MKKNWRKKCVCVCSSINHHRSFIFPMWNIFPIPHNNNDFRFGSNISIAIINTSRHGISTCTHILYNIIAEFYNGVCRLTLSTSWASTILCHRAYTLFCCCCWTHSQIALIHLCSVLRRISWWDPNMPIALRGYGTIFVYHV